jgi:hypothetical protein
MDALLWELLAEGSPDDQIEVLIKLSEVGTMPVDSIRIVAQLGNIASCRIRRGDIEAVRNNSAVLSMKAPSFMVFEPPLDELDANSPVGSQFSDTSSRRPGVPYTGKGTIVGIADWGIDFTHPNFCQPDGSSRFIAIWDQGADYDGINPYGFGAIHFRDSINLALNSELPFRTLNYHPGKQDVFHAGMHGTHVMDIAAGNGTVGASGMAPEAQLLAVHLATDNFKDLMGLGSSVRVFEAIHFLDTMAGVQPLAINLSVGSHGDAHTGLSLIEQAIDQLVTSRPGRAVIQSCGNYFGGRTHTEGHLKQGETIYLDWLISSQDKNANQLELWYEPQDKIRISLKAPEGDYLLRHKGVSRCTIRNQTGEGIGRYYHRTVEPNSKLNQVVIILDESAESGKWEVIIYGKEIIRGRYHAWIERDRGNLSNQSRFAQEQASSSTTTGSICNGFHTICVGAYNDTDPETKIGFFSSMGPTWDGRQKPDLVAPGVGVLAAKSASPYQDRSSAELIRKTGTSMAAPYITGLTALLYESATIPLAIGEVRNRVLNACSLPKMENDLDKLRYGHGIVSIDALFVYKKKTGTVSEFLNTNYMDQFRWQPTNTESLLENIQWSVSGVSDDQLCAYFESLPDKKAAWSDGPIERGDILIRRQYGHHQPVWYGIVECVHPDEVCVINQIGRKRIQIHRGSNREIKILKPDSFKSNFPRPDPYSKNEAGEVSNFQWPGNDTFFNEDLSDPSVVNLATLRKSAATNQISTIHKRISKNTCDKHPGLPDNPLIGVTDEMVRAVYNACNMHSAITLPHVLMAIWKKEGSDRLSEIQNIGMTGLFASSSPKAISLFRSQIYYVAMGMDELVHFTPVAGKDNEASFLDGDADDHDLAFNNKIKELVKSGHLKRNLANDINKNLSVTMLAAGKYKIVPNLHFYIYNLLVMDAMFRHHSDQLIKIPDYGGILDIGLIYMHWNAGHSNMIKIVKSANLHRYEQEYQVNGQPISLVDWAFERCPKEFEWRQGRRNAVRMRYFSEVFQLVFA